MRSILLMSLAAVGLCAAPALSDPADPTSGPWWKAPDVFLSFQPEDADEGSAGGFLVPFLHLEREGGEAYRLTVSSRRVMAAETVDLPDCEEVGTARANEAGGAGGTAGRFGRVDLRDLGDGIVQVSFERNGGCVRNGRYLATWTAPH
jgi:hypothetical protein